MFSDDKEPRHKGDADEKTQLIGCWGKERRRQKALDKIRAIAAGEKLFFFFSSFFNFTRNEISVPAPEEKRERSRSFLSFFRLALALSQVQGVVFVCTQCI